MLVFYRKILQPPRDHFIIIIEITLNTAYIICGNPGVGKTTYARKFAHKLNACCLDIDIVTERLVKTSLRKMNHNENDRDSAFFKETFRTTIYETLFDIAIENLKFNDVIISAPFTKELSNPNWLDDLRKRLNTTVEIHLLVCPLSVQHKRLIERASPRDHDKLKNWESYITYYEDIKRPSFSHTFIDTSLHP